MLDRLRALGYGVGVAVAVFTYLGLPILRRLYGPEVILLAYAGIALIAGAVTYALMRRLLQRPGRPEETVPADSENVVLRPEEATDGTEEARYYVVEQELEQLREDE